MNKLKYFLLVTLIAFPAFLTLQAQNPPIVESSEYGYSVNGELYEDVTGYIKTFSLAIKTTPEGLVYKDELYKPTTEKDAKGNSIYRSDLGAVIIKDLLGYAHGESLLEAEINPLYYKDGDYTNPAGDIITPNSNGSYRINGLTFRDGEFISRDRTMKLTVVDASLERYNVSGGIYGPGGVFVDNRAIANQGNTTDSQEQGNQTSAPVTGGGISTPTPSTGGGIKTLAPDLDSVALKNPLKGGANTIPKLLNLIIKNLVIPIGGVIVVFMIIYTGFLFVMAQGNETKLQKAKATLVHTVIGAAIILGAFSISIIIESTLSEITDALK